MNKKQYFYLILFFISSVIVSVGKVEALTNISSSNTFYKKSNIYSEKNIVKISDKNITQDVDFHPNKSSETSQGSIIPDAFLDVVAKTVFNKAFKRDSPELKDASNTSSEKEQWNNFLEGTTKTERWIIGTPEEGHAVKLHAYYINHNSDTTVVVQHGYNANSMSVKDKAELFWNQGYNVLIPDARGTGLSEGNYETLGGLEPKDMNLWIKDEVSKGKKIILFGESMGAATVMLANNLNQVKAIIEDCGFTTLENELIEVVDSYIDSIPGAASLTQGAIERTIAFLNKNYYQPTFGISLYSVASELAVAKNGTPKLFIHGTADKFVPFKDLAVLFGNASGFKKKFIVNGAGHCQSYSKDPQEYEQTVKNFLFMSAGFPKYTMTDWLSSVSDELKVSQLSIPGTHDSGATYDVFGIGKCQSLSIPDQLNKGIRFLDIRCKYTDGKFAIHHGPIYEHLMFGDVLNQVISFLKDHPKETVFMRVKQEQSQVSDSTFNNTFLDSYANDSYWKNYLWDNRGNNKQNPKLEDIRGKIVVLYNVAGLNFGLAYANGIFNIQDNYNDNYSEKLQNVITYMNEANSGNINQGYINYLSSTAVNSSSINDAISTDFEGKNYVRIGILPADYPTDRLITDIINVNFAIKNRITLSSPKYVIMDPEKKTVVDETGKNVIFRGMWTRADSINNNSFGIGIKSKVSEDKWTWNSQFFSNSYGYGTKYLPLYQNKSAVNSYDLDMNNWLLDLKKNGISGSPIYSCDYESFWNIKPDIEYNIKIYINDGSLEKETNGIPFYIKAPIVELKKDELSSMVSNQRILGKGQVGDKVTIKDGSKIWTGKVNENGNFDIKTNGLRSGDIVEITQTNETGDKSASDPLIVKFNIDWGISVPATISESQVSDSYNFYFGVGKLSIVDSEGNNFEDPTKDRTFSVTGTSKYDDGTYMQMKTKDGNKYTWLYNDVTDQGATKPTDIRQQMIDNDAKPASLENIIFNSKASGNTGCPLIRYEMFGSPNQKSTVSHQIDPQKDYSDIISWTAQETTN